MQATVEKATIQIPSIVSANCYFWSPGSSASHRRSNEARRQKELDDFEELIGEVLPDFSFTGSYSESCKNVYKQTTVKRLSKGAWKRSTMLALKNALRKKGFEVVE